MEKKKEQHQETERQCDQCVAQGKEIELTEGKYSLHAVLCPTHRDAMIEHFATLKAAS